VIAQCSDSDSDEEDIKPLGLNINNRSKREAIGNREEKKESLDSDTESNSEFDIQDDQDNHGATAGLELPTSMINIDLDKFTAKVGINSEDFKNVLKSQGGPFEHGRINHPAKIENVDQTSNIITIDANKQMNGRLGIDSASRMSNEESASIKSDKRKKTKKQTYWKPEEDLKLKQLHEELGNQWSEIQKHFPEKSKDQIHNHIRHLKKSGKLDLIGTKEYEDNKRKKGKSSVIDPSVPAASSITSLSNVSKDDIVNLPQEVKTNETPK